MKGDSGGKGEAIHVFQMAIYERRNKSHSQTTTFTKNMNRARRYRRPDALSMHVAEKGYKLVI